MNRITRIILCFIFLFLLFGLPQKLMAAESVNVYFFWSKTCPHCAKEKSFLDTIAYDYPNVDIKGFEISQNNANSKFLSYIGQTFDIDIRGVPLTIIGKHVIQGYLNDETTGEQIRDTVELYLSETDPDIVGSVLKSLTPTQKPAPTTQPDLHIEEPLPRPSVPDTLTLPIIGTISPSSLSLPMLTFVIALFDGFNPCAMWVLLFLISMLLSMQDRTRMWIIGITFITASAFVYFLFLSAWLNLFLFLGFVSYIRIGIGILALGVSMYYFRDYIKNKSGGCSTVGSEEKKKIFTHIQTALHQKSLPLALMGIILVAFAVNIIELVCSAGLPAIYTHVLSLHQLPQISYYGYLMLYILVFMADDLFVFFVAMTTLHAIGIQYKYARMSRLIGSIVLFFLGILLILKPEYLMFS